MLERKIKQASNQQHMSLREQLYESIALVPRRREAVGLAEAESELRRLLPATQLRREQGVAAHMGAGETGMGRWGSIANPSVPLSVMARGTPSRLVYTCYLIYSRTSPPIAVTRS